MNKKLFNILHNINLSKINQKTHTSDLIGMFNCIFSDNIK